jgi:hypothetical protein
MPFVVLGQYVPGISGRRLMYCQVGRLEDTSLSTGLPTRSLMIRVKHRFKIDDRGAEVVRGECSGKVRQLEDE